jgi:methionyl-tRNA formyltransferase
MIEKKEFKMNIWFCVNKDIHANNVLNFCLPQLKGHSISVFYSLSVGESKKKCDEHHVLEDAELNYSNRLFSAIDRGELLSTSLKTFSALEKQYYISSQIVTSLSEMESVEKEKPDLIISIRFSYIFTKEWIKDVPILNLHSGLLPMYRGILGTLYAITSNEESIGCSLHRIDEKIDSGNLISVHSQDIDFSKSLFWNIHSLYLTGAKLIMKAILDKQYTGSSIKNKLGPYRSVPNQSVFDTLKEMSMSVVDCDNDCEIFQAYTTTQINSEWFL